MLGEKGEEGVVEGKFLVGVVIVAEEGVVGEKGEEGVEDAVEPLPLLLPLPPSKAVALLMAWVGDSPPAFTPRATL